MVIFSESLHRLFKLPYKLAVASDTKKGTPVLFLHGLASNSDTWKYVLPLLPKNYRAITLDLLGFGISTKPKKNEYSIADHTNAVARTLRSFHFNQPIVIVGHSMGALIAIDLAKKHPKLVKSLVLVSAPLYDVRDITAAAGQSQQQSNAAPSNGLFFAYHKILANQTFTLKAARAIMKLAPASNSFILTAETWQPFRQSLTNTIMNQTTLSDLREINIPVYMLYGKLDVLLQQKNYALLNDERHPNITITAYTGAHMITKNAAQSIVDTIITANQQKNNTHRKIAAKS